MSVIISGAPRDYIETSQLVVPIVLITKKQSLMGQFGMLFTAKRDSIVVMTL